VTLGPAGSLQLSPDVFAAVMATGILSVAAGDHSYQFISGVLAALAAAIFVLLCLVAVLQLAAAPVARVRAARAPDVALRLFTFVAACAVLGSRFHTHQWVTRVLAVVATVAWLILNPLTVVDLRSRPRRELRKNAHGAWLLSSVATSGLAITAVDLATHTRRQSWIVLSAVAVVVALSLYLATAWLIGRRALFTPIAADDVTPDTWILMGSLAIAALAGVRLRRAVNTLGVSACSPTRCTR
jgi:tellurite resistance protein TehA-like permease